MTGKLPVLELALPFPVMVTLPEVGNALKLLGRKALQRLQEKKIKRIAAAAVALAWQRSGDGDAVTAVAARRQQRRRRGGRGGSG
jgi:hypothetical protein